MAENDKSTPTPRLRFPEFGGADDWLEAEIGSIASILKGKGVSKSDIVVDGERPCIRYGELYTRYGEVIDVVHSRTNSPVTELFLSRKNDVIVPASGETKLDIAKASCVLHDDVALGSDLNVLRPNCNGVFLSYLLNGSKRYDIARVAQGDTVVHLYPSQLRAITVTTPTPSEQQKIADCLTSLDACVAAQGRKVEALKAHKMGLMQGLYPREGETLPCRRFPEFRRGTGWVRRSMADLLERASKPVSVDAQVLYREIGVRSHGKGIFHKQPTTGEAIGNKRVFWVAPNAFVVNIVFAWEQAVAITSPAEEGMIASHRFPMYLGRPDKCDVRFMKFGFLTPYGKHLLGLASPGGAGRNRTLGQAEFEKIEMIVPAKVEEQARIADCLVAVDAQIAVAAEKLDALNAHKKGLMQQLFPYPEEEL